MGKCIIYGLYKLSISDQKFIYNKVNGHSQEIWTKEKAWHIII